LIDLKGHTGRLKGHTGRAKRSVAAADIIPPSIAHETGTGKFEQDRRDNASKPPPAGMKA
jgi:hypothetical protein